MYELNSPGAKGEKYAKYSATPVCKTLYIMFWHGDLRDENIPKILVIKSISGKNS